MANLDHVKDKITFIEGDIRDYPTCIEATKDVKVVFHLAADISVPGSVENPRHCYETNIMGTVNILEAARRNKVGRVVFSSSSAVYGAQDGVFVENKTPCKPQSPYGLTKWQGEQIMEEFYELYGLETVCMRYFNVFGERQDPNSKYAAAVAKFKDNMANNKPLTFFWGR
jgi:nucleoside-diphosphate-sugar epimerase